MNLSANVMLHQESNKRYQMIYASQVYQTFFTVYAKFTMTKGVLTQVDLRLVNFKGKFNIGIKRASIEEKIVDRKIPDMGAAELRDINVRCVSIDIDIQALNSNLTKELKCSIDIAGNTKDLYLEVTRDLVAIENDMDGLIFDDEFFYRDGLAGRKALDKKGFDGYKVEDSEEKKKEKENSAIPRDPGGLCPRGYSKIYG